MVVVTTCSTHILEPTPFTTYHDITKVTPGGHTTTYVESCHHGVEPSTPEITTIVTPGGHETTVTVKKPKTETEIIVTPYGHTTTVTVTPSEASK
jgi:hypothetical protein